MTSAAIEVQKGIVGALRADATLTAALGGQHVYDHVPAAVPFPYITFGRTSVYDWSTDSDHGTEQLVTLHVWSKERGRKQALELIELALAALAGSPPVLDGHHLVNLTAEFSEVRFDEDLSLYHGLLRFRAVTEPSV